MSRQMGFGIAIALVLDATIVRSWSFPRPCVLLRDWNWYLPRWLDWSAHVEVELGGRGGRRAVLAGLLRLQRAYLGLW